MNITNIQTYRHIIKAVFHWVIDTICSIKLNIKTQYIVGGSTPSTIFTLKETVTT